MRGEIRVNVIIVVDIIIIITTIIISVGYYGAPNRRSKPYNMKYVAN